MSTYLENHGIFIMGLFFTSVVALPQEKYVTDLNYNTLPLRTDEVYSIVNTATKYPLLNTAPNGPDLTFLSHWWQFVPVSENVYYLQTQDAAFNSTAPRWGRFIRLQKSDSHLDSYHMLPATCYNFDKNRPPKNNSLAPTNSYIYVDYFDKYGRDQSECVNRTGVEGAAWSTNLTEERVYTKPAGILDESNFLYKISPVGERVKERLTEERVVEFSAGQDRGNDCLLLLPDLEIKEAARTYDESPADDDAGVEILFFKCHLGHDVAFERTIWSLVVPSGEEFSLLLNTRLNSPKKFLSIEGAVQDGRIGRNSKLVDLDWKIVPNMESNLMTWLTISGLGPFLGNFGEHNTSTNYFSYRRDGDLVKFHYSDTNPNFVFTFYNEEPPRREDGIICHRSYDLLESRSDVLLGHKFEKQCVFTMLTITLCFIVALTYLIRSCIRKRKLSGFRESNVTSSTAILVNFEEGEYSKPEVKYSKPEVHDDQFY